MSQVKTTKPKAEYEYFEVFEAALKHTQLSLIKLKENYQRIYKVEIKQSFVVGSCSRKLFLHLFRQTIEKSTRGVKRVIAYLKKIDSLLKIKSSINYFRKYYLLKILVIGSF
ncbi:MAG: hypothetical protein ACQJCO_04505 [cyanobacterium endosymbiont of Rhopalodia sterrenbergii]